MWNLPVRGFIAVFVTRCSTTCVTIDAKTVDLTAPVIEGLSSESDTPVGVLSKLEAIQVLHETIDSLHESDRELVQLKFFDGLKYREISEKTGLSVGNVGYRLHHILKELAGKLQPLGMDLNS